MCVSLVLPYPIEKTPADHEGLPVTVGIAHSYLPLAQALIYRCYVKYLVPMGFVRCMTRLGAL